MKFLDKLKNIKKHLIKKKIFIDGHQHVHLIPWIFDLIYKKRSNLKIYNFRVPDEKFIINFEDLLKVSILRNVIKFIVIKILIYLSSEKIKKISYNYKFFGIIYSGYQNVKYIKKIINLNKKYYSKNKIELLLHPGFSIKKEKKIFKKNFFNYYSSLHRIKEFNLTLSLKKLIK